MKGNYLIQLAMDHQDLDILREFMEYIDKIEFLELNMNISEAQKRFDEMDTYSKTLFDWSEK